MGRLPRQSASLFGGPSAGFAHPALGPLLHPLAHRSFLVPRRGKRGGAGGEKDFGAVPPDLLTGSLCWMGDRKETSFACVPMPPAVVSVLRREGFFIPFSTQEHMCFSTIFRRKFRHNTKGFVNLPKRKKNISSMLHLSAKSVILFIVSGGKWVKVVEKYVEMVEKT